MFKFGMMSVFVMRDRNVNASLMEIATFFPNKLKIKNEIWAETGKSDTFSSIHLLKGQLISVVPLEN